MQSLERSSVHYHMRQIHFARDILKLDGANASIIAKRVGRSPATVRKWMRDGIPKSAQEDCLKAVKRHNAAVKANSSRSSVIGQKKSYRSSVVGSRSTKKKPPTRSDRKPKTDNRQPKKSARIPPKPVRGKPQKDIGHRTSAVGQKRTKPVSTLSGRKPTAERRPPAPSWEPGTFVPLTEREKGQQREQLVLALREAERISGILEHKKVLKLANQVRKSGVNGMRRVFRLHGKNKNHRKTLYEMIDNEDEAWIKFLEMCEELGMSDFEIRSSWFSPK